MGEIWIAVIGTLGGALIGSVIAPIVSHNLGMKRLREQLFLENRIKYAEELADNIEIQFKEFADVLNNLILAKQFNGGISGIIVKPLTIHELRTGARNIYFKNSYRISKKTIDYLKAREKIEKFFKGLNEKIWNKNSSKILKEMNDLLDKMGECGADIIQELKYQIPR